MLAGKLASASLALLIINCHLLRSGQVSGEPATDASAAAAATTDARPVETRLGLGEDLEESAGRREAGAEPAAPSFSPKQRPAFVEPDFGPAGHRGADSAERPVPLEPQQQQQQQQQHARKKAKKARPAPDLDSQEGVFPQRYSRPPPPPPPPAGAYDEPEPLEEDGYPEPARGYYGRVPMPMFDLMPFNRFAQFMQSTINGMANMNREFMNRAPNQHGSSYAHSSSSSFHNGPTGYSHSTNLVNDNGRIRGYETITRDGRTQTRRLDRRAYNNPAGYDYYYD